MSFFLKYFLILILILNVSCKSNKSEDLSVISEKEIDLQMIDSYEEGLALLEKGDYYINRELKILIHLYLPYNQFIKILPLIIKMEVIKIQMNI